MGIFKANDIRGVFPHELTRDVCYRIGFYIPEILKCNCILIGRDTRNSSEEIFRLLSQGINDSGADVVDIGICDTPAVYFATARYNFSGSIMITASHNPSMYNGMKISGEESVPLEPNSGLRYLEEQILTSPVPVERTGGITTLDISKAYTQHILAFSPDLSGLKLVFDASNGGAGRYLDSLFSCTGLGYMSINTEFDGSFPGHGPNPLEKPSQKTIKKLVRDYHADAGILFDGDGDRAIFFTEKGRFVSPDIITALLSNYFSDKFSPNQRKIYYDIRSSKSVAEYTRNLGADPSFCITGHAKIKKLLRETGGVYAGELSGHYYFKDNYFCDSGFIAAVIILDILKKAQKSFSELVKQVNPYAFSGEINFEVDDIEFVLKNIENCYSNGRITKLDGLKVEFESWWFIMRASGAEPVLRLVVEAETDEELKVKIEELSQRILT